MSSGRRSTSPGRWVADNFFFLAAAIYLLVNGILMVRLNTNSSEWDQVFVLAANKLVAGADIYSVPVQATAPDVFFQITHPFTYPPFHALTAVPVVWLPLVLSRMFWFLVQAVSLTALWLLSWKLSGGKPLNRGKWTWPELIICVLGLVAGMRYIQGAFGHQQSDILIDALLLAGCAAWQKGRDFAAAMTWAVAAAFKGPPLLMAPYLAWRGRWLAAGWMIFLAIAVNLVPDVIDRAPKGIWLTQWYTRIIAPRSGEIGAWYVDVRINQSIAGTAHRYFTTGLNFAGGRLNTILNKDRIPPGAQKAVVYAIDFVLLAAAALAMRRPFHWPQNANVAMLECATMIVLMLLLSPMSHLTHFGILMFPGFIVARLAVENRSPVAIAVMVFVLVSIGLLDHFVYAPIGVLAGWLGNVMWGTVAVGVGCFYALILSEQSAPTLTLPRSTGRGDEAEN